MIVTFLIFSTGSMRLVQFAAKKKKFGTKTLLASRLFFIPSESQRCRLLSNARVHGKNSRKDYSWKSLLFKTTSDANMLEYV